MAKSLSTLATRDRFSRSASAISDASAISGPPSTWMLGTNQFVENRLAVAAEVVPAAAVLAEHGLAELVGGRSSGCFAIELLGNSLPHELGQRETLCFEAGSKLRLELNRQMD